MNARYRGSCCQLFKNLKILPLKSQYIFTILLFVAKNGDLYELNPEIHNINTRFSSDLNTPPANLTMSQKGPFYFGIKVFNHFLLALKIRLMT
jgi:hypothetical protein